MQYAQENKLQPFKFVAWYYSTRPPWQMDIAVETARIPAELSGRIKSRIQQGGEVLIAHMWGPYDKVGQAYLKIENGLKENKRKAKGNPFEIYINDPSAVKSPSEIKTDIYQPHRINLCYCSIVKKFREAHVLLHWKDKIFDALYILLRIL